MTNPNQKVSELDFPPPEELMRRFVSSHDSLASLLGKPEVFSEHIEMFTRLVGDCIDLLHRFTLVKSQLPGISYFQVLKELLAISRFVSPEGVALNSLRLGQSIASPSMRGTTVKPNETLFAALEQCHRYQDTVLPELNRIVFDSLKALRESQPVERDLYSRISAQSADLERIKERFEKDTASQRSEFESYRSTAVESIKRANDEWQQIKKELEIASLWYKANSQLLADAIAGRQDLDAIKAFEERANEHRKREEEHKRDFGYSLAVLALAIAYLLTIDISLAATLGTVVAYVVRNALVFGIATALCRILLKRWNLERNLRLIYEHRVAALKQYVHFDGSILEGDQEAKDRLRMAIAQMIFSDPQTGYLEESGGDLSISPVVHVGEQLAKKVRE